MMLDKTFLDFLEKYLSHPIQKNTGITNIGLVRIIFSALLFLYFLVFFEVLKVSVQFKAIITPQSQAGIFLLVLAVLGVLYKIIVGFKKEENSLLKKTDSEFSNPLKISKVFLFVRIFSLAAFLGLFILLFGYVSNISFEHIVYLLSVFFYTMAMHLYCLNPISRSKEYGKEKLDPLKIKIKK